MVKDSHASKKKIKEKPKFPDEQRRKKDLQLHVIRISSED